MRPAAGVCLGSTSSVSPLCYEVPMRWYVLAPFVGPLAFVAGGLVFVQDLGAPAANLSAARSMFATARILAGSPPVAKAPPSKVDRL